MKLLSFPLLIFSEIVRSMEIMEIFELSQVSRRTLNYLNLARISVETVNIVNGSADKIMVFNKSNTKRVFLIEFLKTPQPVVGQMKVNNVCIDVCKLSPDFDYKKILHFSRLRVLNLGKMLLEDLKTLDSEIANLGNHQFTKTDINEFLHHWIEGNNKKLRRLKLDGFKEAPDWEILLKDIVYTEWNPKERGRYYKSKYTDEVETIDCENGMDFRNTDGQLATVVHQLQFLDFLIWNDSFPK